MDKKGRSLASVLELVLLGLAALVGFGLVAMLFGIVLIAVQPSYWDQLVAAGLVIGGIDSQQMAVGLGFGMALTIGVLLLTLRLRRCCGPSRLVRRSTRTIRATCGSSPAFAAVTGLSMAAEIADRSVPRDRIDFDLTSWLAVLIILVLAEVFREGARLKVDAELTV